MTYTLHDREADTHEEVGKRQVRRIIEKAELHTGPYGAMGSDIDRVLYAGETVAGFCYMGKWFHVMAHEHPFISAELVRNSYDPAPDAVPVKIAIIEAGPGYTDRLETFTATMVGTERQMVEQAQGIVSNCGYRVMANSEGGCNEYVGVSGGEDYIAITVHPK